ncbi:helix-turn-helix domain-containing protein [Streptomyces tendae]
MTLERPGLPGLISTTIRTPLSINSGGYFLGAGIKAPSPRNLASLAAAPCLGKGETQHSAPIMHSCSWQSNGHRCQVGFVPNLDPPDPQLLAFGMHLRRLREARGLTLEELATRSGMSFRGVVYIEHGRRNPSLATLLNLARGLQAEPSTLLAVFDSGSCCGGSN